MLICRNILYWMKLKNYFVLNYEKMVNGFICWMKLEI